MKNLFLCVFILISVSSLASVSNFAKEESLDACPKECVWIRDELTLMKNVCNRFEHCVYLEYNVEKDICEFDRSETVETKIHCDNANFDPNYI